MKQPVPSPAQGALTDLILTMFRTTNLTMAWGDRLVAPLGLTSARWQLLGAIAQAEQPRPVAWLARDLGANRQNVQRIVNDLRAEALVELSPNPHHRRSRLVSMTPEGRSRYEQALGLYFPETRRLAEGLSIKDIEAARDLLACLLGRLRSGDLGE